MTQKNKDYSHIQALSIGEVLFDMFPDGKQPGGAPMNLGLHLQTNGVNTGIVSRVGRDELGDELLVFIESKGSTTDFIQRDEKYPTGTVKVKLAQKTDPEYIIVEHTAWDFISEAFLSNETLKPKYLLHGSLACRSDNNFRTLKHAISHFSKAKVVFDINLRSPFYSKLILEELLERTHILKINVDEFEMLEGWYQFPSKSIERKLNDLQKKFSNIETIILTRGSKGASVWHESEVTTVKATKIEVVNTVGSGDSFLAAFISKFGEVPVKEALEYASATGAYVATQPGANPIYSEKDILNLMNQ